MQKDFFQIRLSDRQIGYLTGGERPNQIVDVTTEQETDGIDRIFPATNTLQLIKIYLSMNRDTFGIRFGKRVNAVVGNDPAVTNKCCTGAVALNFRKDMAGQENCCSLLIPLLQDIKELFLHQWIQTAGGFIQNQKFRTMLQSTDDGNLFSVAEGKFIHLSCRIKLQSLTE